MSANAGATGLVPGLGRSPGEGNGNLFQHSHLGNPKDRGACLAAVLGVSRVGHNLVTKQQQQQQQQQLLFCSGYALRSLN